MTDAVVSCLLTNTKDPQRGRRMSKRHSVFAAMQTSVVQHRVSLVLLHDCLHHSGSTTTLFVPVQPGGNPYFHRWQVIADWLETAGVDRVWCIDATDVVMLHDPFPHMQSGVLYTGSEPRLLGVDDEHNEWLRDNHRSQAAFLAAHPERPFLNPGILGGDTVDVLRAARMLAACEADGDLTDMGAWQHIAYLFADQIVTGHPVHTEYRAYDHADPFAWWAHK